MSRQRDNFTLLCSEVQAQPPKTLCSTGRKVPSSASRALRGAPTVQFCLGRLPELVRRGSGATLVKPWGMAYLSGPSKQSQVQAPETSRLLPVRARLARAGLDLATDSLHRVPLRHRSPFDENSTAAADLGPAPNDTESAYCRVEPCLGTTTLSIGARALQVHCQHPAGIKNIDKRTLSVRRSETMSA